MVKEAVQGFINWSRGVLILSGIGLSAWLMIACAIGGAVATLGATYGVLSVIAVGVAAMAVPLLLIGVLRAFVDNYQMLSGEIKDVASNGWRMYTVWGWSVLWQRG